VAAGSGLGLAADVLEAAGAPDAPASGGVLSEGVELAGGTAACCGATLAVLDELSALLGAPAWI
jgi:hypothetical protein